MPEEKGKDSLIRRQDTTGRSLSDVNMIVQNRHHEGDKDINYIESVPRHSPSVASASIPSSSRPPSPYMLYNNLNEPSKRSNTCTHQNSTLYSPSSSTSRRKSPPYFTYEHNKPRPRTSYKRKKIEKPHTMQSKNKTYFYNSNPDDQHAYDLHHFRYDSKQDNNRYSPYSYAQVSTSKRDCSLSQRNELTIYQHELSPPYPSQLPSFTREFEYTRQSTHRKQSSPSSSHEYIAYSSVQQPLSKEYYFSPTESVSSYYRQQSHSHRYNVPTASNSFKKAHSPTLLVHHQDSNLNL
eukprot:Awhi_evm1s13671